MTQGEAMEIIREESHRLCVDAFEVASRYKHHCAGKEAANRKLSAFNNVYLAVSKPGSVAFALGKSPEEVLDNLQAALAYRVEHFDGRPSVRIAEKQIVARFKRWAKLLEAAKAQPPRDVD